MGRYKVYKSNPRTFKDWEPARPTTIILFPHNINPTPCTQITGRVLVPTSHGVEIRTHTVSGIVSNFPLYIAGRGKRVYATAIKTATLAKPCGPQCPNN